MKRILILRGISGSGKSTFAKQLIPEGYYIVSRDQRRLDLLGEDGLEKYFEAGMDPFLEEYITKLEEREIVGHLVKGHKLIIDNTHLKREYVQALVNLFYETDTNVDDVEIIEFEVTLEEARRRCDLRDKKPISDKVLNRQYQEFFNTKFSIGDFKLQAGLRGWIPKKITRKGKICDGHYEPRKWFVPDFDTLQYIPDTSLPKAVIIDLDGTTAHRDILMEPTPHMRSYYSYKDVYEDEPDEFTKTLVHGLMSMGIEPVFLSGRKRFDYEGDEYIDVEAETRRYIEDKLEVSEPTLFMRDPEIDVDYEGNDLRDDIVKHRILHQQVAPEFCVIGALDDRARVSAVWEDIGIKCLNCASINEIGRY